MAAPARARARPTAIGRSASLPQPLAGGRGGGHDEEREAEKADDAALGRDCRTVLCASP